MDLYYHLLLTWAFVTVIKKDKPICDYSDRKANEHHKYAIEKSVPYSFYRGRVFRVWTLESGTRKDENEHEDGQGTEERRH